MQAMRSAARLMAAGAHCVKLEGGAPMVETVRFLVDGASLAADAAIYERVVLLFDGEDPDAVEMARARWSEAKAAGADVTYWRADENGRWQRQAGA